MFKILEIQFENPHFTLSKYNAWTSLFFAYTVHQPPIFVVDNMHLLRGGMLHKDPSLQNYLKVEPITNYTRY